jgi:hypothetical protein
MPSNWKVEDDGAACITWQNWKAENNLQTCIYLYEVQNGYLLVSKDGNFQSVFKKEIAKGNHLS